MKYYVYFDAFGHVRRAISEKELTEQYQNNVGRFLEAMCRGDRMSMRDTQAATWEPSVFKVKKS